MNTLNENILQSMTSGLLAVNSEGLITFINKAAEEILRCHDHPVVGLPVQDVIGPEGEIPSAIAEILHKRVSCSRWETSLSGQDGPNVPVGVTVSALRNERGEWVGAVVALSDLGELEERRQLGELTALGGMAAMVAHRIRNPLAAIVAGVQYLAGKFTADDPLHRSVEQILSATAELNQLIEDILLAFRPLHLHTVPCAIADVLDSTLSHWETRAEAQGITIETTYVPDLPLVQADPLRLRQAFSNIVSNTFEAMPAGGRLWIAVQGSDDHAENDGYLEVEIADTGTGIPAHVLEKIFEPFFSTKAKGTGLGLTIASRIIAQHGGDISVRSQEGQGATFIIKLPV